MAGILVLVQKGFYSSFLLPAYVVLGLIVYLAALRLLKAVQEHDIELIRKYLGTRLGFASKLLGIVLVEVAEHLRMDMKLTCSPQPLRQRVKVNSKGTFSSAAEDCYFFVYWLSRYLKIIPLDRVY